LSPIVETIEICKDKLKTHHFLKDMGIAVPNIYDINTPRGRLSFPVMVKPINGRGGEGIKVAECFNELRHFYNNKDYILQEDIDGEEYTVDILSDLEGKPISIVPRIRMQVESGICMKGKTVYDEKVIELSGKIATKLGLVGGSCIQCIKGETDYKFTDINLRFGGGALLALEANKTILPNLERIIRGEKTIISKNFQRGLTMLRYYTEIYTKE